MKTIIIEDEIQAVVALKSELALNCPTLEILGVASSIKEALPLIKSVDPALVFLDIQLKDGTGFELLEKLGIYHFKIIFTTAYSQYAIDAIKVSAIDYILKPIDADELIDAVEKVKRIKTNDLALNNSEPIKAKLNPLNDKLALQTSKGVFLYELNSIIRLQSESNYTAIYHSNAKKEIVAKILRDFELLLADAGFVRIHNSHIINLKHLKSYINKDGGYVVMSDNTTLPVSKRKKSNLLSLLH